MKVKTFAKLLTCVAMLTGFAGTVSADNRWEENGRNALDSARFDNGETITTSLSVDVLIWKPIQANLDYAITRTSLGGSIYDGTVHYVDHEYDVGFRIPFSFNTSYDGWNINFDVTYFSDTETASVARPSGGGLHPIMIHPETLSDLSISQLGTEVDAVTVRNKIRYNAYDLYLSRPTYLTNHVDATPFFGVKVLSISQNLSGTAEVDASYDYIHFHNDAETVCGGLTAGMRNSFHILGGLSLSTKFAASLVAGEIEDIAMELLSNEDDGGSKQHYVVDERNAILPGVELAAAFNFETYMGDCSYLNLRVGYEFVHWWNTPNQRRYFNDERRGHSTGSSDGQLGFHGVFIGGDFTF